MSGLAVAYESHEVGGGGGGKRSVHGGDSTRFCASNGEMFKGAEPLPGSIRPGTSTTRFSGVK